MYDWYVYCITCLFLCRVSHVNCVSLSIDCWIPTVVHFVSRNLCFSWITYQTWYLFKVCMHSSLSDCTKLKLIIISKICWYIAFIFIDVNEKFLSNKCTLQSLNNCLPAMHLGSSSRTSLKSTMQVFIFTSTSVSNLTLNKKKTKPEESLH